MRLKLKDGYTIEERPEENSSVGHDCYVMRNGEDVGRVEFGEGTAEVIACPGDEWAAKCIKGVWLDNWERSLHTVFVDAGLDSPWEES